MGISCGNICTHTSIVTKYIHVGRGFSGTHGSLWKYNNVCRCSVPTCTYVLQCEVPLFPKGDLGWCIHTHSSHIFMYQGRADQALLPTNYICIFMYPTRNLDLLGTLTRSVFMFTTSNSGSCETPLLLKTHPIMLCWHC